MWLQCEATLKKEGLTYLNCRWRQQVITVPSSASWWALPQQFSVEKVVLSVLCMGHQHRWGGKVSAIKKRMGVRLTH